MSSFVIQLLNVPTVCWSTVTLSQHHVYYLQVSSWSSAVWRLPDNLITDNTMTRSISSCFLGSLQSTPTLSDTKVSWVTRPLTPPDNSLVNNSNLPGVVCCWRTCHLLLQVPSERTSSHDNRLLSPYNKPAADLETGAQLFTEIHIHHSLQ